MSIRRKLERATKMVKWLEYVCYVENLKHLKISQWVFFWRGWDGVGREQEVTQGNGCQHISGGKTRREYLKLANVGQKEEKTNTPFQSVINL